MKSLFSSAAFMATILLATLCLFPALHAAAQQEGLAAAVDQPQVAPSPVLPLPEQPVVAPQYDTPTPVLADQIRHHISRLMMVSLEGSPRPNASDLAFLRACRPGGVVLPPLSSPANAAEYVGLLMSSGAPLLIAADLYALPHREWGPVDYFPPLPSLLTVAAANDQTSTQALATLMANHLSLLGVNLLLGPSLELAPIIQKTQGSIQILGDDPTIAADVGSAIVSAINTAGIIAAPMGFPGGGSDSGGSGPLIMSTTREHIMDRDALPYAKAIESGAPVIHVGTTIAPSLDKNNIPACLSENIMRDLLRHRIGFKGLVLAGPIDAPGLSRAASNEDPAVTAIRAGADMLLWNNAGQRTLKAIDAIIAATQTGSLPVSRILEASARLDALIAQYKLSEASPPKPSKSSKLEGRHYSKEAYEIERRSITLLKNNNGLLPIRAKKALIGVTGVAGVEELRKALGKTMKKVAMQPITSARHGGDIYDFEIDRVRRGMAPADAVICILTPQIRANGQATLIRAIKESGAYVIAVLVGYPGSVDSCDGADAILLSYAAQNAIGESMRAVADAITGDVPVRLRDAVRDIPMRVGVPQKFNALDVVCAPAGSLPLSLSDQFTTGFAVPYNPEWCIKKIEWDFGDGSRMRDTSIEKAYSAPGKYPIMVNVTDSRGETVSATYYAIVE